MKMKRSKGRQKKRMELRRKRFIDIPEEVEEAKRPKKNKKKKVIDDSDD